MGARSLLVRSAGACALILAVQAFTAAPPAGAQIWVVTGPDGSQRFTSEPEPGARVYVPTPHTRALARAAARPGAPSTTSYVEEIAAAAGESGLDPHLIRAVIANESAFDPAALSPKGASGLMQLMPATARSLGVGNIWNPRENIRGGTAHLGRLLARYDDLALALAAYNAGEEAVDRYGGIPPYPETQEYVRRVLRSYERYQRTGAAH